MVNNRCGSPTANRVSWLHDCVVRVPTMSCVISDSDKYEVVKDTIMLKWVYLQGGFVLSCVAPLPPSKKDLIPGVGRVPFCVEFTCSPCVCVGSLHVPQLPPRIQRHTVELSEESKLIVGVSVIVCLHMWWVSPEWQPGRHLYEDQEALSLFFLITSVALLYCTCQVTCPLNY